MLQCITHTVSSLKSYESDASSVLHHCKQYSVTLYSLTMSQKPSDFHLKLPRFIEYHKCDKKMLLITYDMSALEHKLLKR